MSFPNFLETFYIWSGLKINKGTFYLTIYGNNIPEPKFVSNLGINWCTKIYLIGYKISSCDYEKGNEEGHKQLEVQILVNFWGVKDQ